MRALFVGGPVDNSELDLEPGDPPQNYPDKRSGGHSQYRLHRLGGGRDGRAQYAVYAARDMVDDEVERICVERDYAKRFAER